MLRTERAESPSTGTVTMVLVDDRTYEIHPEARDFSLHLQARGRSPHTRRNYLPQVGRYLNWCSTRGTDWRTAALGDLAWYKLSLEQTPVRDTQQLPTGKTANAHLSTVCEFLRFSAAQGYIPQEVAERLVEPRLLHHAPRGYQRGEHGEHSTIRARILKAPEIEEAPATLTA
ncbi:site-specific integrase [Streptomyces sp. NPDC001568]|uniref:site-specific integrase n=1 Tax=Streptomyces sp. NPDC001568 TaxID=3364588 RepID=UPI0036887933